METEKFDENVPEIPLGEGQKLTENLSLTYSTSKDARLDFFFHVIEGSEPKRTTELLEKSWQQSPLDTMKLVINCRDVRGGKGIREQSLICLHWLYREQFENLMLNLEHFDRFGCWKDYLNLLLIALFDILPPHDFNAQKDSKACRRETYVPNYTHVSAFDTVILRSLTKEERRQLDQTKTVCRQVQRKYLKEKEYVQEKVNLDAVPDQKIGYKSKEKYFNKLDEKKKLKVYYKFKTDKAKLRKLNEYRRKYFENAYEKNEKFKKIYDKIVDLFAKQIYQDHEYLIKNEPNKISLASKWLPNHGRFYDKYLFIVEPIAIKFFQLKKENVENSKSIIIQFSKILSTLRKNIKVPEQMMSARQWDQVDYKCVPSRAMLRYRQAFIRHDKERLDKFMESNQLKGGAVTPADLVKQLVDLAFTNKDIYEEPLVELNPEQLSGVKAIDSQWKSLVDDLRSKGTPAFRNTLAVCDVSGSMLYTPQKIRPIYGSIGLTLFLMQISDSSWNNCCIAFSENPTIYKVNTKASLLKQVNQLIKCPFGYNTDFNKVFDLILTKAKEDKLAEHEMPRVLFVFTDMEFDVAQSGKTNFDVIEQQYAEAGYKMPFIIFWNLKGEKSSKSTPVQCQQKGVLLLSGFSAQTFNFLFGVKDLDSLTPLMMLIRILNNPKYECIKVLPEIK